MLSSRGVPPSPAQRIPELWAAIPTSLDEGQELAVTGGRARDSERLHLHGMRPLLIVEHEWRIGRAPQLEEPARNHSITKCSVGLREIDRRESPAANGGRLRIAESLARVGKGFGVHAFVEEAQL